MFLLIVRVCVCGCVCVGVCHLMQINDRLHIINNVGPVIQPRSAEMSWLSVRQLDFHTLPGGGRASRSLGGEGGQRGRGMGAEGAEGAGGATLCPQLLLMSLGSVFTS